MKKLLFILLLSPLLSKAQKIEPRFENDTLYTSGGYKIFKGQTLQLAGGTSAAGYFKYIKFHSSMARTDTYTLQNGTILVEKLRNLRITGNENYNIRISGIATLADGKKMPVDMTMDFEKAISGSDGLAAEMIVPAEYKTRAAVTATIKQQPPEPGTKTETNPADLRKLMVADEIKKLFDLYKAGALTKEEYDTQKKKLLDRQ